MPTSNLRKIPRLTVISIRFSERDYRLSAFKKRDFLLSQLVRTKIEKGFDYSRNEKEPK
jgi:hypothetical protein